MNIKRSSGILMPVSALPSKYGIGSFGKEAFDFVDFLASSGQSYWQFLPLVPVGTGNSPYMSYSSFAGNPLLIDLDLLAEDGLLSKEEVNSALSFSKRIDFDSLKISRMPILLKAKERGYERDSEKVNAFVRDNPWVLDYSLFMSCKKYFNNLPWNMWPDESIKCHNETALWRYSEILSTDIDFYIYVQYLFFAQWTRLRDYVHSKGISLIGDLPIYVAHDSADVWAAQDYFLLDDNGFPSSVAGVPPDYFSADGQLWGNPLYDLDKMKADGYGWWIRRIDGAGKLYDVIRLDHFRAFDEYWSVPAGSISAKQGEWKKGPGLSFIQTISGWFPHLKFIAEDLGLLNDSVRKLVSDSGFPGMKVLQFAFVPGESSDYLPHNCIENSVCYTGTHDNDTLAGWLMKADAETIDYISRYTGMKYSDCSVCRFGLGPCDTKVHDFGISTYNQENAEPDSLGCDTKEYDLGISTGNMSYIKMLCDSVIRNGMASSSRLFIAQLQDYLYLDSFARINTPGTVSKDNWSFRLPDGLLTKKLSDRIYEMTKLYGRR